MRSQPTVRAAALLVAAVTAIWGGLDEYLPLLAVEAGEISATVPLLVLVVYAGMALGGLAATSVSRFSARLLAALLVTCAAALAAGALTRVPAGFVLVAVAFGGVQALAVAAVARLQAAIADDARSTITSFAALVTEVLVVVFAAYAAGSEVAGHATLFALFSAVHVVVAAWLVRTPHLPDGRARATAEPSL